MVKLTEKSLVQLCLASSQKYKEKPAFLMLSEEKIDKRVTYTQFGNRAKQIGALLQQLGVPKGGRVMLLSENSPQWCISYFGIAMAEAVSVPLLPGFSSEQVKNIAAHAEISAVCLSRAMTEKLSGSFSVPIIYIDTITGDENNAEIIVSANGEEKNFKLPLPSECTEPAVKEDDLATIIYTSGTQGNSKGVMLSGKNIVSCAISVLTFINMKPRDRMLSVLPLAHSYECTLGLIGPVICGSSITYLDRPPSASVLLPAVKVVRPTVMAAVPLFIEKIYNNSIAPKLRENKLYKFPLTRPLAERVAGRKLIKALGGKMRFFGIGGAPLSPDTEEFLYRARFPYAIGYGLTEAAPLVTGNPPLRSPIRSAGVTAGGVSIRIAKCEVKTAPGEGEIQVKGPNVMLGYYKDKEKTAEAFTSDGWLRTGDLGCLDKKGNLCIRGRLKALILSPTGENIYPEEIEGILNSSQLVEDALVYSGKKGEIVALVYLTDAAKAAADAIEQALEDLRLWANKKLADFSRISRIEVRYEPFEKTPTMKIKRYLYV